MKDIISETYSRKDNIRVCRGIDLQTGKYIYLLEVGSVTNNIAEFLSIAYAIRCLKQEGREAQVFSSSLVAISWWKKNICGTKEIISGQLEELLIEAYDLIEHSQANVVFVPKSKCENLIRMARIQNDNFVSS